MTYAPPAPQTLQTTAGPMEFSDSGGNGPVLLSLHGGMGGYDQSWFLAQALLTDFAAFRVLSVSRPGYCGTPQSAGSTPEAQSDAFAALLNRIGIQRAHVAAVSAGGPPALHFALRHPDRCERLVLVSAATGPLETAGAFLSRLRQLLFLSRVPGLLSLMRRRTARHPYKRALRSIKNAAQAQATLAHPISGPLMTSFQDSAMTFVNRRIPGTITDTRHYETMSAPAVELLEAPVLVVHGNADQVVPVGHALRLLRSASNARGVILPEAGHMALFTHLDSIRAAVSDFFAT